jgi:hypothetical protein
MKLVYLDIGAICIEDSDAVSVVVADVNREYETIGEQMVDRFNDHDALTDQVRVLREALEQIQSAVPAIGEGGGLYRPHFDGEGNEIGLEDIDPLAVIQCMTNIADAALALVQK